MEWVYFPNLEYLRLDKNKISNINVLETIKFKKLKSLLLIENLISDIKILDKMDSKVLEKICIKNFYNMNLPLYKLSSTYESLNLDETNTESKNFTSLFDSLLIQYV